MSYNPYMNTNQPPVPPIYQGQPVHGQPVYQGQPPMYLNQPQNPNVIVVNTVTENMNNVYCNICRKRTQSIIRRTPGMVTFIWCFALAFAGFCLCCVPFCVDDCKDMEIVCTTCQALKKTEPAKCC